MQTNLRKTKTMEKTKTRGKYRNYKKKHNTWFELADGFCTEYILPSKSFASKMEQFTCSILSLSVAWIPIIVSIWMHREGDLPRDSSVQMKAETLSTK